MLANTTIEGLKTLRLDAMAAALAEQHEQAAYAGLGFDERLGLLVDRELTERGNRRIERCLKTARLRTTATIEDIDFRHPRGLDRAQILTLAQAHWAAARHAVVITGPTGAGKTYLACALAHAAIRKPHRALPAGTADVRRPGHRPRRRQDVPPDGLLGPDQRPGHR